MCELFGVSAKNTTNVQQTLETFAKHGGLTGPHKDGWGIAYFDKQGPWLIKAPEQASCSTTLQRIQALAPESSLIISHIRLATQGEISMQNTQPFCYHLEHQAVVFAHNGHLPSVKEANIDLYFQPEGSTDSEIIFSALLHLLSRLSAINLDEKINQLEAFLQKLSPLGPLNILFSDGDYLYAFSNKRTQADGEIRAPGMYMICRSCSEKNALSEPIISTTEVQQHLVLFASVPLSNEQWQPMQPNKLYVAKNGELVQGHTFAPYNSKTL